MLLTDMHVMFRQYAQQMGMQNVRAILPEQIDLLINTSIYDTVNQIIKENIGITNDRIITDNSKIGQINALRSLYKVKVFPTIGNTVDSSAGNYNIYSIDFDNIKETITTTNEVEGETVETEETIITAIDFLFLVDLAIDYTYIPVGKSEAKNTNLFPIRIIDDAYLADTLNDFVLKPRVRTPIAVAINNKIDVYVDLSLGGNTATPKSIRCSYIAKPAKVQFVEDVGGTNVECDLPEYLHIDIVKHAVDLWRIAVSGSMYTAQQQEQNQQRENLRNNYRNDNNTQQR